MARILQGNLHRSRLAHDLLPQFVAEEKADILLISEQYTDRDTPGWVSNDARTAAVWVPRRGIAESGTGDDYVGDVSGKLVMGDNFNAMATEWGMTTTNCRGKAILEMAARLSLVDWHVMEEYTANDHQYILFDIQNDHRNRTRERKKQTPRWNTRRMNRDRLAEEMQRAELPSIGLPQQLSEREKAEALVERTTRLITELCDAAMPRVREAQKALKRQRPEAQDLYERHDRARKRLRDAIKESKRRCWAKIVDEVEKDPFGDGYAIVTRKIGEMKQTEPMEAEVIEKVIDGLFPTHPIRTQAERTNVPIDEIPPFTEGELIAATSSLKSGRAPGLDGIPAEMLKVVAIQRPELILEMYNLCLIQGVFSSR
ncbi:uncharacterized protein LOC116416713 [Nasonia vitripennis]|uniref:Endonuclease/exonuclease/phosphatase domain-containing protein n=1 Tax=Nasonia vitripennis TaxID=7425 RepID=A0A7M7Q7Y1_NASVI|nr:uncharacterized protein LOC116416713 [Nasonia vitripennis]